MSDAKTDPDAKRVSWSHGICTICWFNRYPGRAPVRMRMAMREREQCCDCGMPTIDGIYIREDPWTVNYPRRLDRDE